MNEPVPVNPDSVAPAVTFTIPTNGDTGVAINKNISATFTEAMDPATISTTTFTVTGPGGTPVSGTVAYSGITAVFTPAGYLAAGTTYTATITTGAKDLAGNAPASDYVWSFTTGANADTTAPTVSSTIPVHGATGVPINWKIAATFSEGMDPTTISTTTFTLKRGTTTVLGAVNYVGLIAVFTPTSDLAANTTYEATITTGAKDLAHNALAVNKVWTFTTGAGPDTTAPTVRSTIPDNGDTGVATNENILATFSEGMDPATLTNVTFTLKHGATMVEGAVTCLGAVATFNPTSALIANTTYEATITTGAKDLAHNALAVDKVWTFTTGVGPDITPPSVDSMVPLDLATNEALNVNVTATFSEGMDPATLTNVTFTLKHGITTAEGDVTCEGTVATLNPTSDLMPGTTYEARITTGAKDLANNALVADKTWSFTTATTTTTTTTSTSTTTTTSTTSTTTTTGLAPGAVPLGSAESFGVMAIATITNAGNSIIDGDIALNLPGTAINGFPPGVVNGTTHNNDSVSIQAKADLLDAYNFAKGLTGGIDVGTTDLGQFNDGHGLGVFPPGTYESGSTMNLGTDIILDGGGNANAVWVFQIGSSLLLTAGNVSLTNEAQAKNVFWVPTTSATIGGGTTFYGTIVAGVSVTCNTGARIYGRVLAGAIDDTGAVSLDTNHISVPAP